MAASSPDRLICPSVFRDAYMTVYCFSKGKGIFQRHYLNPKNGYGQGFIQVKTCEALRIKCKR